MAPSRGSPGPSFLTQGSPATIRISLRLSRPSKRGFSTWAKPPDSPKPRWSNDSTP